MGVYLFVCVTVGATQGSVSVRGVGLAQSLLISTVPSTLALLSTPYQVIMLGKFWYLL